MQEIPSLTVFNPLLLQAQTRPSWLSYITFACLTSPHPQETLLWNPKFPSVKKFLSLLTVFILRFMRWQILAMHYSILGEFYTVIKQVLFTILSSSYILGLFGKQTDRQGHLFMGRAQLFTENIKTNICNHSNENKQRWGVNVYLRV